MRFPNEPSLPATASAAVWPVSGWTEGSEAPAPHCGSPAPARSPACPRGDGGRRPQPILLRLHRQTPKDLGDAASGTTRHASHFAPVLSGQGRCHRSSQVQPNPGYPGPQSGLPCRPLHGAAPRSVLPGAAPSRAPAQGRPFPARAQPCPPLAQSLREDGGPVTGWRRRGSEHGTRREAAPSVTEDGPLTCQPPAPPDRPPAGSSPQPRCPATAQNTRGRPRRETARKGGTAGPGRRQQRRAGAGLAATAADPSFFGPENVSTSRLQIPNAPSRSSLLLPLPLSPSLISFCGPLGFISVIKT